MSLRTEVVHQLERGDGLAVPGQDHHDGRLDLRGITLANEVSFHGKPAHTFVDGVVVESVDLSFSRLDNVVFRNARLADVVFDRATTDGLAFVDSALASCSFERAKLREFGVSRSRVEASSFVRASLQYPSFSGAELSDCDFTASSLRTGSFSGTDVIGCRFPDAKLVKTAFAGHVWTGPDGPLPEPELRAVSMEGTDFRRARFAGVDLKYVDPVGVVWPDDDDVFVVEPFTESLQAALGRLGDRMEPPVPYVRDTLERCLRFALEDQRSGYIDLQPLRRWGGTDVVAMLRDVVVEGMREVRG